MVEGRGGRRWERAALCVAAESRDVLDRTGVGSVA